jgi:hypothetical protein
MLAAALPRKQQGTLCRWNSPVGLVLSNRRERRSNMLFAGYLIALQVVRRNVTHNYHGGRRKHWYFR